MGILSKVFSGGAGELVGKLGGVVERFAAGHLGKKELALEMDKLVAERESDIEQTIRAELSAKESVIVAELAQGDGYTKRARPTVVYAGLAVLAINHVALPWAAHFSGQAIPVIELPTAFWAGWSGIVVTWSIGRTMERRGSQNGFTKLATGSGALDL